MWKSFPDNTCMECFQASAIILTPLQKKQRQLTPEAKKLRMKGIHARIKIINVWRMIE